MNTNLDYGFGVLFNINKILELNSKSSISFAKTVKNSIQKFIKKFIPIRIKALINNKLFQAKQPQHIVPLYFHNLWESFMDIVNINELPGCTIYGGETWATLSGRESEFCIGLIGQQEVLAEIRSKFEKSNHYHLAPAKRRILEVHKILDEPLMKLGTIEKNGHFHCDDRLSNIGMPYFNDEIKVVFPELPTSKMLFENKLSNPEFKLLKTINLSENGGAELFIVKNEKEQPLFLWSQDLGIFHSSIYTTLYKDNYMFLDGEPREHFCLTATDIEGNFVWQYGIPFKKNIPYIAHTGDHILTSADIDNDGIEEIIIACAGRKLMILNSKTGKIKKSTSLPYDNFATVKLAKTSDMPNSFTIMVQVSEQGWPPHSYCNPILFFDSNLSLLKQIDLKGAGHVPLINDFDGDGFDEFIIGYNMIDHDLNFLWTMDYWFGRKIDPYVQHVDFIAKIGEGEETILYFAGSDMFYCCDVNGKLIYKKIFKHPQHVLTGKFRKNGEWGVFLTNCADAPAVMMTPKGDILWEKMLPDHWPKGKPDWLPSQSFHMGCPASVLNIKGRDWILYNEGGWPYLVDGDGHFYYVFQWQEEAVQTSIGKLLTRPDDYGYGFHASVFDFDTDGRQEVIIYNRNFAWIFKSD